MASSFLVPLPKYICFLHKRDYSVTLTFLMIFQPKLNLKILFKWKSLPCLLSYVQIYNIAPFTKLLLVHLCAQTPFNFILYES